jgi:hypothetical protein
MNAKVAKNAKKKGMGSTLRSSRSLRSPIAIAIALVLAIGPRSGVAASDHYGQVTFAGLPVPGATVIALQGDTQRATVTDQQGVYRLGNLADGAVDDSRRDGGLFLRSAKPSRFRRPRRRPLP